MTGEQQIPVAATDEWAWGAAANPIPRSVEVVIIGGGIIGCSTAYFLAREGVSVALFEKGRIAGEQSGLNWGWVRQQGRSAILGDRTAADDPKPALLAGVAAEIIALLRGLGVDYAQGYGVSQPQRVQRTAIA